MVLPGVALVAPIAAGAANAHLSLARDTTADYANSGQFLSYNWAGYATYGQPNGSVVKVSGAWVQPAVTCPSTGTQYAAFWVGIDGFSSDAVEQTGTLAICDHGVASYAAWWEMFPTNAIQVIPTMTVSPGDHITASVLFHPKLFDFTMTIYDRTTGSWFAVTAAQAPAYAGNPAENSAECIIERPAEITNSGQEILLHLANFGSVSFSSCQARVSGVTAGVSNFASSAQLYMIGLRSTVTHIIYLASPGAPTNLVTSGFTTAWQGYA
jgi:hypothetical protein